MEAKIIAESIQNNTSLGQLKNSKDPNIIQYYLNIKKQLENLGIQTTSRIHTIGVAEHIITQRTNLLKEQQNERIDITKPVVVILYARSDYNKAFDHNQISKIIEHGNQVLFFEIDRSARIKQTIDLLADKLPNTKEITFIIGGHGNKDNIDLYGKDESPFYRFGEYAFKNMRKLNIKNLILESCNTGSGGKQGYNMANLLAKYIRIGNMVFAPLKPVSITSGGINYMYQKDGSISRVVYKDVYTKRYLTYHSQGKFNNQEPEYMLNGKLIQQYFNIDPAEIKAESSYEDEFSTVPHYEFITPQKITIPEYGELTINAIDIDATMGLHFRLWLTKTQKTELPIIGKQYVERMLVDKDLRVFSVKLTSSQRIPIPMHNTLVDINRVNIKNKKFYTMWLEKPIRKELYHSDIINIKALIFSFEKNKPQDYLILSEDEKYFKYNHQTKKYEIINSDKNAA